MKKAITVLILTLILIFALTSSAFAAGEANLNETEPVIGNIFDTVYDIMLENSDKILSALAFAASLALILVYKRGLLPLLKNALTGLGASVSRMREQAEKSSENSAKSISAAAEKLALAEITVNQLTQKLSELEKKLVDTETLKEDSEILRTLMTSQIDMLYEVFMSSSLPAYRKDVIGERITMMRKLTSTGENKAAEVISDESISR